MKKVLFSLYQFFFFLRCRCNQFLDRPTLGVRAIVVNSANKVLLITHSYQPGWFLPGGGVKAGETLVDAIIREVYEEAGVEVLVPPTLFAIYSASLHGSRDYPILFIIHDYRMVPSNSFEIAKVGWFSPDRLPNDTTAATRRRIAEFFQNQPISSTW